MPALANTLQHFTFFVGVTGVDISAGRYEDALFEAGCDDALITVIDGQIRLDFDREAESYESAVASASHDIQKAGAKVAYVEQLK